MTNACPAESPVIPASLLATIPNGYPALTTRVRLTYPFAQLCPVSGEPQPGSTITISYNVGALLLETKALRQYLASFAGENPYGVRDLEQAAQVIAQACADVVQTAIHGGAKYHLPSGEMEVDLQAEPRA